MATRERITEGEIISAIRETFRRSPDAKATGAATVNELHRSTGWARSKVCNALLALKAAGRLEMVRVPREALDGRVSMVPAYRVKKA